MSKSSITTADGIVRMPPIHPGEFVREDVLEPLSMSVSDLAEELGVQAPTLQDLVEERIPLSAELAGRLARYLGSTPRMWLALQMEYELDILQDEHAERIEREVQPRTMPPLPV